MRIERYCGRERLSGGERRWRRLARRAGFDGRLSVQGFGIGGKAGRDHRALARGAYGNMVMGEFWGDEIKVWLRCACGAADPEDMDDAEASWEPTSPDDYDSVRTFAHELGHFRQWKRDRVHFHNEALAERFGRFLLRRTP